MLRRPEMVVLSCSSSSSGRHYLSSVIYAVIARGIVYCFYWIALSRCHQIKSPVTKIATCWNGFRDMTTDESGPVLKVSPPCVTNRPWNSLDAVSYGMVFYLFVSVCFIVDLIASRNLPRRLLCRRLHFVTPAIGCSRSLTINDAKGKFSAFLKREPISQRFSTDK